VHVPDGFLSTPVASLTAVAAAGAVAIAVRRAGPRLDERTVPLLGVTAAFVFAAQMLSFPVAAGTSGHVLGAALATVLLGPWLACIVLAVVLAAQALVFADGGLTALGAGVVAMGVVGVGAATLVMAAAGRLAPRSQTGLLAATAVGSWLSVVLAAATIALFLAVSGTVPLGTVLPAMVGVHALIGVGEAVVTGAAVAAVLAARPDLVDGAGYRLPGASARAPAAVAS
jgi:cobalt/nickel transport system permease protein